MSQGLRRGQFAFPDHRRRSDDGCCFVSGDQGLTISVSEEKAIDSENEQFECTVILKREYAEELYAWLGAMLS